jgi:uncharacterized protein (DUF111 family)
MKKNRPGHVITVIADKDHAENLAEVLIAETGTFGVREIPVTRHISSRANSRVKLIIKGQNHSVRVKLSKHRDGKIVRGKLEYEDLRKISDQTGIAVRQILTIAKPALEKLNRNRN